MYLLGPKPKSPKLLADLPPSPKSLIVLEDSICRSEGNPMIKNGNEAKIIWAKDSVPQKTHYSLVYLHGFSASEQEGNPLNREFAKRYGCNLFLSRLAMHGLKDSNAFEKLTADTLFNTAKSALKIGTQIGDSVILMATSAGGALALTLAAIEDHTPIKALILYSPCIKIFDPNSKLLDGHWGLQLARMIVKSKYNKGRQDSFAYKYWYPKYRLEGLVALQNFLDGSMKETNFKKIKIPVLCLDYYKDQKIQDSTVSVSAIHTMFAQLGTPSSQKTLLDLPNVGDHVLASFMRSKDLVSVRKATFQFAETKLGMKPVF